MTRLTIRLDDLIPAMEDHSLEVRHYLDCQTGEVVSIPVHDDLNLPELTELCRLIDEDEEDRFRIVDRIGSSQGWQLRSDFTETLRDGPVKRALIAALDGNKPFRRFKDALLEDPKTRQAWFDYHAERMMEIAREWLGDEGIGADLVPVPKSR